MTTVVQSVGKNIFFKFKEEGLEMQFRDLKRQYDALKTEIDDGIATVIEKSDFISGQEVLELEQELAEYVGVKHCITCGNGTDALDLALMAWGIGEGDAVFVPDFTFFASGEVVSRNGAVPVFVDVRRETYSIDTDDLERKIKGILEDGHLTPRVVVAVDLFGLPADYGEIRKIADRYDLRILEDSAQGFGGSIQTKGKGGSKRRMAGSFGDIATTSFFPAKPLGCYGDGGAIFTDDDGWASLLDSLRIHGKGDGKYDNVRIGMNSRLDTLQAAILIPKLKAFQEHELDEVNKAASRYGELLNGIVETPSIPDNYISSWAQYTVRLPSKEIRDGLQAHLRSKDIPSMVYYQKPMHAQLAFQDVARYQSECKVATDLCDKVLSLPIHPYITADEQEHVSREIRDYLRF